jgi:LmeA-like phospholipid-binding
MSSYEPTQPLRRQEQPQGQPQGQPQDAPAAEPEYPPEPPTVGRPVFNPRQEPQQEPRQEPQGEPPARAFGDPGYQSPQPGFGQPGFGQPGRAQPGMAQPGYDQPPYGQPADDQPPYDQPAYGQPGYGQPGYGQPGYQPPESGRPPRRRRRRRIRRTTMALFTLIVLVILLLIGDRVANAIAENEMADQFTSNGFPVKPSVDITGFPFLTQLAGRDFKKVLISASNIPAGPVTITSLNATLNGMHITGGFSGAKIDQLNATAFVSFSALGNALGTSTGITITPDGTDRLKITAGIGGIISDTEEAQIKQTGPQTISVQLLNSGGALGSILSGLAPFTFNLPAGVPASLRITGFTLNDTGLTLTAAATNAVFSK